MLSRKSQSKGWKQLAPRPTRWSGSAHRTVSHFKGGRDSRSWWGCWGHGGGYFLRRKRLCPWQKAQSWRPAVISSLPMPLMESHEDAAAPWPSCTRVSLDTLGPWSSLPPAGLALTHSPSLACQWVAFLGLRPSFQRVPVLSAKEVRSQMWSTILGWVTVILVYEKLPTSQLRTSFQRALYTPSLQFSTIAPNKKPNISFEKRQTAILQLKWGHKDRRGGDAVRSSHGGSWGFCSTFWITSCLEAGLLLSWGLHLTASSSSFHSNQAMGDSGRNTESKTASSLAYSHRRGSAAEQQPPAKGKYHGTHGMAFWGQSLKGPAETQTC